MCERKVRIKIDAKIDAAHKAALEGTGVRKMVKPYGNRTWAEVTTESLIATIHSRYVGDLPWACAAAEEYVYRCGRSPLKSYCFCPYCRTKKKA